MSELEEKYKDLSERRQALLLKKAAIQAELAARRRELKSLMDQIREEGFDPNKLETEIAHLRQILTLKLDNFQTEINEAELIIEPMINEINNDD